MPLIEDLGTTAQHNRTIGAGNIYTAYVDTRQQGIDGGSSSGLALNSGRKRAAHGFSVADSSTKLRAQNRRLAELERENYHENVKIDIPKLDLNPEAKEKLPKGGAANRAGVSVNSRRILASRKTLANHLDDDTNSARTYLNAVAPPPTYPPRKLCSICGYWGKICCIKCGARYCGAHCEATHKETRCQKYYS
ncbi:hypothetical protein TRICI_004463 [Trichomonascus ciferrii]|uniref:HIT-type domain-containing protein n=1 Tax=Trichomonascus ciferrii TaxID=44093 RepID=A0A642V139_9ASCO|nr:hypothetical protein TRICI_004463 [Trichomonascus ciferrii]